MRSISFSNISYKIAKDFEYDLLNIMDDLELFFTGAVRIPRSHMHSRTILLILEVLSPSLKKRYEMLKKNYHCNSADRCRIVNINVVHKTCVPSILALIDINCANDRRQ